MCTTAAELRGRLEELCQEELRTEMMIAHTLAHSGGPVSGEGGPFGFGLSPACIDASMRSPDKGHQTRLR